MGAEITEEFANRNHGIGVVKFVENFYDEHPWQGKTKEEVWHSLENEYLALVKKEGAAMPGAMKLLGLAKKQGCKTALASSSTFKLINHSLERLDLLDSFDAVVSAQMEDAPKPQPDVYLEAARQLGLNPSECVVFEDAPNGIKAAKAAGMKAVAVVDQRFHKPQEYQDPDLIVKNLEEVTPEVLDKLLED